MSEAPLYPGSATVGSFESRGGQHLLQIGLGAYISGLRAYSLADLIVKQSLYLQPFFFGLL